MSKSMEHMVVMLIAALFGSFSDALPTCRNAQAQSVDWWAAVKFPGGDAYAYVDNTVKEDADGKLPWRLGYDFAVTDAEALTTTLAPLYSLDSSIGYVMWNDEFPGGVPPAWETAAHAKGVMGFDAASGFYLLHSVPKFPAAPCTDCPDSVGNGSYTGIALGQQVYGQSFLCVSMAAAQLDRLAQIIGSEGVWVYDHFIPRELLMIYPNAGLLTNAPYGRPALEPGAPMTVGGARVSSAAGQQFLTFAKSPTAFYLPLYEQVVAPYFQKGMLWETWQNGRGDLPQLCPAPGQPFFSFTVAAVELPSAAGWYVSRDHSKWGFTSVAVPPCCHQDGGADPNPKSVCFGDLNRQEHQGYRGGGALCFVANDAFWLTWSSLVVSTRNCTSLQASLMYSM